MENDRHIEDPIRVQAYISILDAVRQDVMESATVAEKAAIRAKNPKSKIELARTQLKLARLYSRVEQTVLQDLVDATPVRRLDESRAMLEQRAIEAILSGTEWLTGDQIGARFNPEARNKHAAVSRWLAQGKVFAIERRGQRLFARYQFDESWQPLPAIATVLAVFEGYSSFRIAGWFESTNARLDDQRPRDVIQAAPETVLAAAHDHVAGPLHG